MRNYMKVLAIGLMLAVFGGATGNAQTYTTVNAGRDSSLSQSDATYLTARNQTYGSLTATNNIGQFIGFGTSRTFMFFPLTSLTGATVLACSLYADGLTDYSTTDFTIDVLAAPTSKSVYTTADFINFDGWQTSGTYTGTILSNTWNSSSFSADWNVFVFNAAGNTTVQTACGDTLWIVMMSHEDYVASAPVDDEYIRISTNESATRPYLAFTYTTGWSGTIGNLTNPAAVGSYSKSEIKEIR